MVSPFAHCICVVTTSPCLNLSCALGCSFPPFGCSSTYLFSPRALLDIDVNLKGEFNTQAVELFNKRFIGANGWGIDPLPPSTDQHEQDVHDSEELYRLLPDQAEGELTRLKSAIVSRGALYLASQRLGLARFADFARGVSRREELPVSVTANLVEAVIGAIYLDAGFFPARDNVVYVDSNYLYGTYDWVASNTYILTGFTYVMSNSVLNIEPGTVIKGVSGTGSSSTAANDFGCLFVCRGGKINAAGTAGNPIIFTAELDDVTDPSDLAFPSRG